MAIAIFSWFAISCLIRVRPEGLPAAAMNKLTHITPHFAVTGALQPADFAADRRGRLQVGPVEPAGRGVGGPSHQPAGGGARSSRAGSAFATSRPPRPTSSPSRVVDGVGDALRELPGPVLAHCASGMRSAVAWATAAARVQPVDAVLETAEGRRLQPRCRPRRAREPARSRPRGPHPAGARRAPRRVARRAGQAKRRPDACRSLHRCRVIADARPDLQKAPDFARRRGSSSRSNQGLAVSQALLRQEGCGSATRRGRVSASSSSRQRLTVAVMPPAASASMCQRCA